jgi:hypothetical protein
LISGVCEMLRDEFVALWTEAQVDGNFLRLKLDAIRGLAARDGHREKMGDWLCASFMRKHIGVDRETRYASLSLSCGFEGSFLHYFLTWKVEYMSHNFTSTQTFCRVERTRGELAGRGNPMRSRRDIRFDTS